MISLFLAAAAAASVPTLQPGVVVFSGTSNAVACYDAALVGLTRPAASSECDRALEQPLSDRDRLATHVNRGLLYMSRGQYAEAARDFETASSYDPLNADLMLNKGILLVRMEKSSEAVATIDRALALKPARPELAYYARGLANEDRGDLRAAYADLQRAQALAPSWQLPARQLARFEVQR